MITYEQIQAIHEAMRECEELGPATYNDRDGYECATFDDADVRACFAKIRAAFAGEASTIPDAISERDAKLTAVEAVVREMEAERDEYESVGDPCGGELRYFAEKLRAALACDPFERKTPGVSLYEAGREAFMRAAPEANESDERMVRPEDVAPPVVERTDEDSKTTWQG
jgi:hypothetical protein